jgi:hypothetical protein
MPLDPSQGHRAGERLPSGSVLTLTQEEARELSVPMSSGTFNTVVYGGLAPLRVSPRLWAAMLAEFERNGRRTLTAGKVRSLRRAIRRSRPRS